MRGQHFSVDGEKFYNFYAALRWSDKVKSFSEYVIPREHLDAFESVKQRSKILHQRKTDTDIQRIPYTKITLLGRLGQSHNITSGKRNGSIIH